MLAAGVAPDVHTFATLMNKSGSEERAAHWYEAMLAAGVAPDDVTFATLINKSATEAGAARWREEMRRAGVARKPDASSASEDEVRS
jgi:hypothetical protein